MRCTLLSASSRVPAGRVLKRGSVFSILGLVAFVAGCVTTNFTQPVASFQKSVNTSSVAIGSYFTNLNEFERQLYFDDLAFDPAKRLEAIDSSGQQTPLLGHYFAAASIKARMDSLALLGVYAQRLTDLAGSNAPQEFSTGATKLGESLSDLDKTFAKLSQGKGDATATAYVGPISALVGSIGKMALERERAKAIGEAVNNAAPAVRTVLDNLEHDLLAYVKPLQETGLLQEVAERVRNYNDHREDAGIGPTQRREWLDDIESRATAYEAALAFNPSALVGSMRQAHEALLKYVNAPKTPSTFNDLVGALHTFDQNAQEVAKEVEQIRQIGKGK